MVVFLVLVIIAGTVLGLGALGPWTIVGQSFPPDVISFRNDTPVSRT
jgi:hypothetical protein